MITIFQAFQALVFVSNIVFISLYIDESKSCKQLKSSLRKAHQRDLNR